MILVSSCLLGLNTKYSGKSNDSSLLIEYCSCGKFVPVCPEQLGGLPTPRAASEIIGGSGEDVLSGRCRIMSDSGDDETDEYIRGAEETLKMAKLFNVTSAILKQRSPSCGNKQIYDGTFSGNRIDGQGVVAALLSRNGIPVFSEEELTRELLEKLISQAESK
jgi:Uncharacterized conserved protein